MSRWQNLDIINFEGVGKYNIPELAPTTECDAKNWMRFSACLTDRRISRKKEQTGVHFFLYDGEFERCWSNPTRYGDMLLAYNCVLSPDFSLYTSFPKAVQIWNHYRKQWLAKYWQEDLGLTVIPTVTWGDESSYEFCFDGQPKHSIVAVSNIGCCKKEEVHKLFLQGYNEMLNRLEPELILVYTRRICDYPGNVKYIHYTPFKNETCEFGEEDA